MTNLETSIESISCPSAGNCSAGGEYLATGPPTYDQLAFVVNEVHGTWQTAEQLPGTLNNKHGGAKAEGPDAQIDSVSCASVGNCAAGGYYTDRGGEAQPLLAVEVDGRWQEAEQAPGIAALNQGDKAQVNSVSCAPAGTCVAGGYYHHQEKVLSPRRLIPAGRTGFLVGSPRRDRRGRQPAGVHRQQDHLRFEPIPAPGRHVRIPPAG